MTAPRKSKDGLGRVLYVRVDEETIGTLDVMLEHEPAGTSRGDLVRTLLWEAIEHQVNCGLPDPRAKWKRRRRTK